MEQGHTDVSAPATIKRVCGPKLALEGVFDSMAIRTLCAYFFAVFLRFAQNQMTDFRAA